MASVKKQVKKYIKENQPSYEGLDKEQKKLAKAEFDETVADFKKAAKKKKRKHRFIAFFLMFTNTMNVKLWRDFHSRASKKYKKKELGHR